MKDNKKWFLIILGIVIFFVGIIIGLIFFMKKPNIIVNEKQNNIRVSTETVASDSIETNQKMTYYDGFENEYRIKLTDTIPLGNQELNSEDNIYMEYVIYKKGKEIFRTDLIEPGTEYMWEIGKDLGVGTFDLVFYQQPYKVIDITKPIEEENLKALYYIDQNVSVTITD